MRRRPARQAHPPRLSGQNALFLWLLGDIARFSRYGGGMKLRAYQVQVAETVVRSVIQRQGLSIVVMFPRQSGKNEVQAHIETYLLRLYSRLNGEIVKVSPTLRPQSLTAMRRLERVLKANLTTLGVWKREAGYIFRVERARIVFLSGSPLANIVGATASLLLEVDEAQDVEPEKYDREIAPMAASTNATRVFWGTAWSAQTLLGRELRLAKQAEQRDGRRRVFVLGAAQVAAEVKAYGRYVDEQVARLGRDHPLVRSQFFSEEIGADGGLFNARRLALMRGGHPRLHAPRQGAAYAFLIDVAGEDEAGGEAAGGLKNPGRDSTALTVVEVDTSSVRDELVRAPTYRVVERCAWTGAAHSQLYQELRALGLLWKPRRMVIDATGVGAGLASFLAAAFPGRVTPFTFSAASKSSLGWDFLAVVETGRFKDWGDPAAGDEQEAFFAQCAACQAETVTGPGRVLRWGVPDGTRDAGNGELVHDDWLLSAALCCLLDGVRWGAAAPGTIIRAGDPLAGMEKGW